MLRRLIIILMSLGFILSTSACSSSKVEDGDDVQADESIEESEAGLDSEGFVDDEEVISDLGDEGLSDEESLPEDDSEFAEGDDDFLEEGEELSEGDDDFAEGDEFAEGDDFAEGEGDELAAGDDFAEDFSEEGSAGEEFAANEDPLSDSAVMDESSPMDDSYMDDSSTEAAVPTRSYVPVKKIADTPYEKNGVLVNAVYIVRDGDNLSSISQRIYGSDKTDDLKAVNTWTANRKVKVGDKIYYNSPKRNQDREQLLTYYEDMGLSPEIYISKPGENIREVSTRLLGNDRSWMEVYATNPEVETKWGLNEGTQLRYWASSGAPTTVAETDSAPEDSSPDTDFAANDAPEPPPMEEMADEPPPPEPEDIPEPPVDVATNDIPPPPPPPAEQENSPPPVQAAVEPPPPPPPPPPKPPTRPKPQQAKAEAGDSAMSQLEDPDNLMALGVAFVVLVAAVLMVIINRKKKAKQALDFNTQTSIE